MTKVPDPIYGDLMINQQNLFPELDSPLVGKVKGERASMAYPFFALTKGRRMAPLIYKDQDVTIEIRPSSTGLATIYDKEILLYVASLMVEKMNSGESPGQEFTFTAHDFLRVTGSNRSARSYQRLSHALERLQGTQIRTNIEAGGEGEDGFFSWVSEAKVQYYRTGNNKKRLKAITIRLCDWLYRAIKKDTRILTYDQQYFSLSPVSRRLYELARSHCGHQERFVIGLEKLRKKVGSEDTLAKFKHQLNKIAEENHLPEYSIELAFDPNRPRLIEGEQHSSARRIRKNKQVVVVFQPKLTKAPPLNYLANAS
jgi:plasmid replication initiation protein